MSLIIAVLALALSGPVQATPAGSAADAEARRVRALVEADYKTLDGLLADDLTYTHSTAALDTKASYLAPLLSGRTRYQSLEPSEMQVRTYGDMAVITGMMRSTALVAGQESRTVLRFTNVWIRRDGRWQMVAWQATRIPG